MIYGIVFKDNKQRLIIELTGERVNDKVINELAQEIAHDIPIADFNSLDIIIFDSEKEQAFTMEVREVNVNITLGLAEQG